MRALILKKPSPIEEKPLLYEDVPMPVLKDDEILVAIKACGICHTDLHIIEGELKVPSLPVIPGHQIVGRVKAVGKEVKRFKIGDKVGIAWLYETCGVCEFCMKDKENLCLNGKFTGFSTNGGYAEYIKIKQDFAYHLKEGLSEEETAPLLCAGIIGFRAFKLSGIKPKGNLGLYGFGASAHLVIQVANYFNCQSFVFSRSEEHRRLAGELGAVWTGHSFDESPEKLDAIIIFAPAGSLVPKALKNLKKAGSLVLAGIFMSNIPELPYSYLYEERIIRSVANATRKDGIEFLNLANEVPIKTKIQVFDLTNGNEALILLKEGKIQGAGVLKIQTKG